MANLQSASQRLVLAGFLGLATVAGPVAVMATSTTGESTPLAACTTGEEQDVYTMSCVPFLVPLSPDRSGFTTTAANPDIPEIDGVPCTGHDAGACIGLAEEQQAEGPQPVPRSTISASP
ncbi:intersectin-EH binding protein Ibp1 [Mycolicibacterium agri]|uniref:Intersectin-EH-binding protein Ibp1 n=1 Tax=Mycolicibacterium agri TaxID=36811 RepID=A0A2A7MWF5_MYCAG|nr:intersectin-EH binding protein Ibp1 [Mycolicibacterium agri]PEG36026.1 intersectin-EH binding protein Ibp1 [Mycolicibacterium agri]GFG54340.1 intersectin-EH-binding protein Ibp1 [Mycolicibacterium agri]